MKKRINGVKLAVTAERAQSAPISVTDDNMECIHDFQNEVPQRDSGAALSIRFSTIP